MAAVNGLNLQRLFSFMSSLVLQVMILPAIPSGSEVSVSLSVTQTRLFLFPPEVWAERELPR